MQGWILPAITAGVMNLNVKCLQTHGSTNERKDE